MVSSIFVITISGLFIASFIEFFISFLLLKQDKTFRANQLLSIGFLFIGLTIFINLIYFALPLPDDYIIDLSRITNSCAIVFGIFLFATVSFIRFGNLGFKKNSFWIVVGISILGMIGTLFYNGIGIFIYNDLPQTTWDNTYLVFASFPILLLGSASVYYFFELYKELGSDKRLQNQIIISIIGYSLITIAYFVSRMPFYLMELDHRSVELVQPLSLIASVFVVMFSILIAWIFIRREKQVDVAK